MSDLPTGLCSHPDCLATKIALQIQGHSVCIDHIDWGMAAAMRPLKRALAGGELRQAEQPKSPPLDLSFDTTGDKVVVRFDREVAWFAMGVQEAANFATRVLQSACKVAQKSNTPLQFRLPEEMRQHGIVKPDGNT